MSVGSILVYLHYLVFFNVVFIYHVVHNHPFRLANSSLWYNLVTNRRTNRIGKLISSHLPKIIFSSRLSSLSIDYQTILTRLFSQRSAKQKIRGGEKFSTNCKKWKIERKGETKLARRGWPRHLFNSGSPRSEHEGRRTNERNYVRGILGAACESRSREVRRQCVAQVPDRPLPNSPPPPLLHPGLLLSILFSPLSPSLSPPSRPFPSSLVRPESLPLSPSTAPLPNLSPLPSTTASAFLLSVPLAISDCRPPYHQAPQ